MAKIKNWSQSNADGAMVQLQADKGLLSINVAVAGQQAKIDVVDQDELTNLVRCANAARLPKEAS
jgi:hypothetical protein